MPTKQTMSKEIRLPAPHPQLRPRVLAEMRRPGHPGTAVRIGEDLYEVVAAERLGGEWVYRLEPWSDQETIRTLVDWGEGSEREFIAGRHAEELRQRKNTLAWLGQVFIGFLPAERQERRSQAAGLDPARATLWSAVLETILALPIGFLFFIGLAAGGAGGLVGSVPAWAGLLACVVLADGVFRLLAVLSTGEPIGSLFLAVLDLRSRSDGPGGIPGDEISRIEGELIVRSPVPKVWWERAGGVTFEGVSYVLTWSGREKTRYLYRFLKGGGGFPVLDLEREKARNRSSDLSYVFAPLWGFLPADLQRTLESYGRYRARPYVVISVVFNALLAFALAGPGLRAAARGLFEAWPLVKLALAAVLLTESGLRLARLLKDGTASGSILGFLVRPVYDSIVKERPSF